MSAVEDAQCRKRPRLVPVGVDDDEQGQHRAIGREQDGGDGSDDGDGGGDDGDGLVPTSVDSNAAIVFKLVGPGGRVLHEFSPEFSHQLFEDEAIYGYDGLRINVYLTLQLQTHVEILFESCEAATSTDGDDAAGGDVTPAAEVGGGGGGGDGGRDGGDDDGEEEEAQPQVLSCAVLRDRVDSFTPTAPVALDEFFGLIAGGRARWPHAVLDRPVLGVTDCGRFCFTEADLADTAQREIADRLQHFAFFYIDAAERVDLEDDRWRWVTLWTRSDGARITRPQFSPAAAGQDAGDATPPTLRSLVGGGGGKSANGDGGNGDGGGGAGGGGGSSAEWVAAGYLTMYHFTNPVRARPKCARVCQVLVLPPFQRRGLGAALFRLASADPAFGAAADVLEVTVEDPCPGFVRLRDAVDLDRYVAHLEDGLAHPHWGQRPQQQAQGEAQQQNEKPRQGDARDAATAGAEAPPGELTSAWLRQLGAAATGEGGWGAAAAARVQDALHITRKQACRCFEAVRLAAVPPGDADALRSFRLAVKRRLYPAAAAAAAEQAPGNPAAAAAATKQMLAKEYAQLEEAYTVAMQAVRRARQRRRAQPQL